MKITVEDGKLEVERPSETKAHRALHGTTRALLNNMVLGVSVGFKKDLKMIGVGYRSSIQGNKIVILAGYSHPVELEIPEIAQGIIEIKAVAREAGRRTKIAVITHDKNIPAVGTCIGAMGNRIQNVTRELNNERIDVIEWNQNPKIFIAQALSPAKIEIPSITIGGSPPNCSGPTFISSSMLVWAISFDDLAARAYIR